MRPDNLPDLSTIPEHPHTAYFDCRHTPPYCHWSGKEENLVQILCRLGSKTETACLVPKNAVLQVSGSIALCRTLLHVPVNTRFLGVPALRVRTRTPILQPWRALVYPRDRRHQCDWQQHTRQRIRASLLTRIYKVTISPLC